MLVAEVERNQEKTNIALEGPYHPYKYNSTYGSIIPPTLQLRQLATMCPQLQ